jgi:hypothetical protein
VASRSSAEVQRRHADTASHQRKAALTWRDDGSLDGVDFRCDILPRRPILILHAFRFAGLAFIVPGVVSPELPSAFARPAAYGDLGAAILAIIALGLLRSRPGIVLLWLFSLWGSADLLYAFYEGGRHGLAAGDLGAAYFIVILLVPLLLVTHGIMFRLLLKKV